MSRDWSNRHWIIRNWPQPPEVWAVVIEKEDMCRKSLDGSLVLLKWWRCGDGNDGNYFNDEADGSVYDMVGNLELTANNMEFSDKVIDVPE